MISSIISWFTGGLITKWLTGAVLAGLIGFVSYEVWDYKTMSATVATQTATIANLKASLKSEQSNREQDATTILTLNNRLKALQEPGDDLDSYCAAMAAAAAAPDAKEPAGSAIGEAFKKILKRK